MTSVDDILNRHLIAIATGSFQASGTFGPLDVDREVSAVRSWLTDPALGDRTFDDAAFRRLASCPTFDDIREQLTRGAGFNEADAVVLYVTGHGLTVYQKHWVVLHDSDPVRLSSTAVASSDLVRWLADHEGLSSVLLVIDLCQAGDVMDDLPPSLMRDLPDDWIALVTTPAGVDAKVGAFTGVLGRTLTAISAGNDPAANDRDPYLMSHLFLGSLKRRLWEEHRQRLVVLHDPYKPSACLPNPRYNKSRYDRVATTAARRDLAILPQDMIAHWTLRAPVAAEEGAVFTGRAQLIQLLIDFTDGRPGSLVVTGRAGSGKSAALARLVTCSDPVFRANHSTLLKVAKPVPPEGAVDIAVLATGKTSEQIAQQIARALGVEDRSQTSLQGWISAIVGQLQARSNPATIVLDALDEASDPTAVALTLLEPLNPRAEPSIRLVVGIRSSGADDDAVGSAGYELADVVTQILGARSIRVDGNALWDSGALVGYVEQLLSRGPSALDAATLARAVEHYAGRSFLVAGLVARYLATSGVRWADDDPRLAAVLSRGLSTLLRSDLEASIESPQMRSRAMLLLRASALAFGRGIPWHHIWPILATAIASDDTLIGESDVEWLLGHRVSGYLVRDIEDGITVYRPFHDELRASLAAGVGESLDLAVAHRRISQRLVEFASWERDPS